MKPTPAKCRKLSAVLRGTTAKRRIRFPGIGSVAKTMGVSREHLYRVLAGERISPDLIDAYNLYRLGNLKPQTDVEARKAKHALEQAAPALLAACELAISVLDMPFKDPGPAQAALESAIAQAKGNA